MADVLIGCVCSKTICISQWNNGAKKLHSKRKENASYLYFAFLLQLFIVTDSWVSSAIFIFLPIPR